jgi:deoxyribodipyrimidine photo-lyase
MNGDRAVRMRGGEPGAGPVVYWMSRDQRALDNWALLYAQDMAMKKKVPLLVSFSLANDYLGANLRHYGFMLKGLRELEGALSRKNIPFFLLRGNPPDVLPGFLHRTRAGLLVCDFNPLRIKKEWESGVASKTEIPLHVVDAHNVVPCWIASLKQEYAAYTFRPKLKRLIPRYLVAFPRLKKHPHIWRERLKTIRWEAVSRSLDVDRSVSELLRPAPGENAGRKALAAFLASGLAHYERDRNDPSKEGQSGLSPYLHFGQLSAARVALEVQKSGAPAEARAAFMEELLVRRELSDNFCHYNPDYDNLNGLPEWARRSLDKHRRDRRPHIYARAELENARTHDPFWNAAQKEMVNTGKMHGYMRMYWAKKMLEWTESPDEAIETAVSLNDTYELDGRDPNGYAGILWSIGGLHDRAWKERPIYGKVRYMSAAGLRAKFDMSTYLRRVEALEG